MRLFQQRTSRLGAPIPVPIPKAGRALLSGRDLPRTGGKNGFISKRDFDLVPYPWIPAMWGKGGRGVFFKYQETRREHSTTESRRRGQILQAPKTCEPPTSHGSDKGYKNPILEAQTKPSGGCTVKTPSVSSSKESQSRLIKAI